MKLVAQILDTIGFILADNEMDLQQARLLTWWACDAIDQGDKGRHESSMAKTAVSEAPARVSSTTDTVNGPRANVFGAGAAAAGQAGRPKTTRTKKRVSNSNIPPPL